jgi:hypothetical protein
VPEVRADGSANPEGATDVLPVLSTEGAHAMSTTRAHTHRLAAVAAALALAVAGCGAETDEPTSEPPAEDPLPDDDGGDASGGTTMTVYSVPEARAMAGEGSIHVTGLLIDSGSGWRLCELVLESYPPQCGGDALTGDGVEPSLFPLEEEGNVRWQTGATVVGEVDGDTLTITGSAASS